MKGFAFGFFTLPWIALCAAAYGYVWHQFGIGPWRTPMIDIMSGMFAMFVVMIAALIVLFKLVTPTT